MIPAALGAQAFVRRIGKSAVLPTSCGCLPSHWKRSKAIYRHKAISTKSRIRRNRPLSRLPLALFRDRAALRQIPQASR
jgi:hypothetical protein